MSLLCWMILCLGYLSYFKILLLVIMDDEKSILLNSDTTFHNFSDNMYIYQLLNFLSNFYRSSNVPMQTAVTFITQNVLQNSSTHMIKQNLTNWCLILVLENRLHVLLINVLSVKKEKIKQFTICNLQCVGAVPQHTTGNAYPGILVHRHTLNFVFQ